MPFLSVIPEEPSGFHEDDLEYVGRIAHSSLGDGARSRHTHTGGAYIPRSRDFYQARYGSGPSSAGRYSGGPAWRSLGGLRFSQTYTPGATRGSGGRSATAGSRDPVVPLRFVRNPHHPKSLYSMEVSMRNQLRGKRPKLTAGLSFPDPKDQGPIRNPRAPKFHHDYEVTEEDFDIVRNPLSKVDVVALARSDPALAAYNRAYVGDDDIDDDRSDNASSISVADISSRMDEDYEDDRMSEAESIRRAQENAILYSDVRKYRIPKTPSPPPQQGPPTFAPQPPPPNAPVQPVLVLPRAYFRENENQARASSSSSSHRRHLLEDYIEEDESPPPLPAALDTLEEEDEDELRDMSTQTASLAKKISMNEEPEEIGQEVDELEDRFVQIGAAHDNSTMTHENWEAVAPWSHEGAASQLNRSDSLAVNYRSVVAELSATEPQAPAAGPAASDEPQLQQQQEAAGPNVPEEPPPWSPPVVDPMAPAGRPTREMHVIMRDYSPTRRHDDGPPRYSHRAYRGGQGGFMSGCCNRCCFVVILLVALATIIGVAVVTALYASYSSNCSTNCGIQNQPGYLAGFIAVAALAVVVTISLIVWCCYNIALRQRNHYKYRP